jgi:hypothetical protein
MEGRLSADPPKYRINLETRWSFQRETQTKRKPKKSTFGKSGLLIERRLILWLAFFISPRIVFSFIPKIKDLFL